MNTSDYQNFSKLINDVFSFYEKPVTDGALQIWWNALRSKDFDAISRAFSAHVSNPDNGQFAPKPANIIKLMDGSTLDNAYTAWTKVEDSIRKIGPYESAVFDDPIIHKVISDMGGWMTMCEVTDHDLPFRAKEFENRYQGYKSRKEEISAPKTLTGIIEAHNRKLGSEFPSPILIGDEEKCAEVYNSGIEKNNSPAKRLDDLLTNSTKLINKSTT